MEHPDTTVEHSVTTDEHYDTRVEHCVLTLEHCFIKVVLCDSTGEHVATTVEPVTPHWSNLTPQFAL